MVWALEVGTREPSADYNGMNIPSRSWLHININVQEFRDMDSIESRSSIMRLLVLPGKPIITITI